MPSRPPRSPASRYVPGINRLAAIVIPPAMGAIADRWGAGESFVILGTLMVVLCAPVTLITRRAARTPSGQNPNPTLAD
jgi:hypothetical protein